MPQTLPVSIPDRLPVRLEVCPILEAVFEARFVSQESWATVPGLLYTQIREKYTTHEGLPLARVPEETRRQNPELQLLPLMQFVSPEFLLQLGPRVLSLVTKPRAYPGWSAIRSELEWIIARVKRAGFVSENDRLGARYVDFFEHDIFPGLRLHLSVNDQPLLGVQTNVTTDFQVGPMLIRLRVTNGAIVATPQGPKPGSVLDLAASFGPLEADLFENGLTRFAEAHTTIKELFFGLIKPELLTQLHPVYV